MLQQKDNKRNNSREIHAIGSDQSPVHIPSAESARAKFDQFSFSIAGLLLDHLRSLPLARDWSIYDICDKSIKPLSIEREESYVEHMKRVRSNNESETNGVALVKETADVFVSYAWGYKWGQIMEALEELDGNTYIWMDLFVINQHKSKESDLDTWLETFSGAIQSIGRVVFILAPWRCPVPVTRAWCVFEILTALQTQVKRDILLPKSEFEDLVQAIKRGHLSGESTIAFLDVLRDINVMRADAFRVEDRDAILAKIRARGIVDVNNVVLLPIKQWYLEVVERILSATPFESDFNSIEKGNAYSTLYALLEMLGRPSEALEAALMCLDCWTRAAEHKSASKHGEVDDTTKELVMIGLRQVGSAYSVVGEWTQAREHLKSCLTLARTLERHRSTLGNRVEVMQAMRDLATVDAQIGNLEEALFLARSALEIATSSPSRRRYIGDCATTLGALLQRAGDKQEAKKMFEMAFEAYKDTLGEDHPRLGMARVNLAMNLNGEGRPDEALKLCEEAKYVVERTLGSNHVEMATVEHNLAVSALLSNTSSSDVLADDNEDASMKSSCISSGKSEDISVKDKKAVDVTVDESQVDTGQEQLIQSKEVEEAQVGECRSPEQKIFETANHALDLWSRILGEEHETTTQARRFWKLEKERFGWDSQRHICTRPLAPGTRGIVPTPSSEQNQYSSTMKNGSNSPEQKLVLSEEDNRGHGRREPC